MLHSVQALLVVRPTRLKLFADTDPFAFNRSVSHALLLYQECWNSCAEFKLDEQHRSCNQTTREFCEEVNDVGGARESVLRRLTI